MNMINASTIENLPKQEQLKTVATQFVSILLSQIFDQMEKDVSKSGLIPEQTGESWYHEWLMDAYTENATKSSFDGLVKTVESQLSANSYTSISSREKSNKQ